MIRHVQSLSLGNTLLCHAVSLGHTTPLPECGSHIGPELPSNSDQPRAWRCDWSSTKWGPFLGQLETHDGWASEAESSHLPRPAEESCLQNEALQRQADVREERRELWNIHPSSNSWSPGLCVPSLDPTRYLIIPSKVNK